MRTNKQIVLDMELVEKLGGYEDAVVLNFITDKSWSSEDYIEDGYVPINYKTFLKERFLTEFKVRRIVKKLKEAGYVDTIVRKVEDGTPTVHYKIL